MDFNNLFEAIKELSGDKDLILGNMYKDGKSIYIELELVEPVDTMAVDK